MDFSDADRRHMQEALALAEKGRGYAEPNPIVGAVVVNDGRVVGRGYTQPYGGPHAEVVALEDAGGSAPGATMYVTLEPCAHQGKTPPCAHKLVEAKLRRVVVAAVDPTEKTGGRGIEVLKEAGLEVGIGLCQEAAVRKNAAFFKAAATGRPLVTAKWAITADGKIATRTGNSHWVSGEEARVEVHRFRGIVDCIAVGIGTVLADDPELTCRDAEKRRTAARLVLCGHEAPSPESRLVQTLHEAPVLLAFAEGHTPEGLGEALDAGCKAVAVPPEEDAATRVSPGGLLEELGRRDMSNVLLEGGARILGSFFDAGHVDRAVVFVAPKIAGGEHAPSAVGGRGVELMRDAWSLREAETVSVGPDMMLKGWVQNPLQWAP